MQRLFQSINCNLDTEESLGAFRCNPVLIWMIVSYRGLAIQTSGEHCVSAAPSQASHGKDWRGIWGNFQTTRFFIKSSEIIRG